MAPALRDRGATTTPRSSRRSPALPLSEPSPSRAARTPHVIASTPFLDANPAAKRWFELLRMPVSDINEQNLKMRDGEKTEADVARHADEWVAAHQEQWDAWIAEAKEAR